MGACLAQHGNELGDRRNVVTIHLLDHFSGDEPSDARQYAEKRWNWGSRIGRLDAQLVHFLLRDGVQPVKGKEETSLDTFHPGPVRHDQAWIQSLQRTLRQDDRDL